MKNYELKKIGPAVPVHKDCLYDSKGYALFDEKIPKFLYMLRKADADCCDFIISAVKKKGNENFLGVKIPIEKQISLELPEKNSIVSPGEYAVTNTFELSGHRPLKKQKYVKLKCFYFSSSFISEVFKELEIGKPAESLEFSVKPMQTTKLLLSALTIFEESFQNTPEEDNFLLIETAALQIITLLFKYHPNNFQALLNKNLKFYNRNHPAIKRALDYIKDNYSRTINLDEIASSAYLNKYYLIELFKKETGQTPFSYVVNYRIEKAKELLKYSELKIEQIAHKIGYKDVRHFRRTFKQTTGYLPRDFYK